MQVESNISTTQYRYRICFFFEINVNFVKVLLFFCWHRPNEFYYLQPKLNKMKSKKKT